MSGEWGEAPSRRRILQMGAGSVLGLAAPAIIGSRTASAVPLRGNRTPKILTPPKLDWGQAGMRCVAGVRPARIDGIRLGLDPALGRAGQHIIHNYGHSGAGITLSLGCAMRVGKAVEAFAGPPSKTATTPDVAIIGSGVAGLTVARELKALWPKMKIRILTKSQNVADCTSQVAGGQFAPSGVIASYQRPPRMGILIGLLKDSAARVKEFVAAGTAAGYGIRQRFNYSGKDLADFQPFVPDVYAPPIKGELPFANLSSVKGFEYDTWLIEPPIFLEALRRELVGKGVVFRWGHPVADVDAIRALPETIVINCSGLGARSLVQDGTVYGIKGQLVVMKNTANLKYFVSGCGGANSASYFFGRSNDMVAGGTYDYNNETTTVDTSDCRAILARMKSIFAGNADACTA